MLKIRLQRVGRVNVPTFRVVLTDSKNATRSGKFLEVLGTYDPVNDIKEIKTDRVKQLIANGAQPSITVHNWLISNKVIPGKKINALPLKKPIVKADAKAAEAPKTAAPAPTEAPKA